jgi:hypothetical protein
MKKTKESTDNRKPMKPAWHIAFVGCWCINLPVQISSPQSIALSVSNIYEVQIYFVFVKWPNNFWLRAMALQALCHSFDYCDGFRGYGNVPANWVVILQTI